MLNRYAQCNSHSVTWMAIRPSRKKNPVIHPEIRSPYWVTSYQLPSSQFIS